jgi:hypothetical protein
MRSVGGREALISQQSEQALVEGRGEQQPEAK